MTADPKWLDLAKRNEESRATYARLAATAWVEYRVTDALRYRRQRRCVVTECTFCLIVAGLEPATVVYRWYDADAIVAVPGCAPGHLLILPVEHADSAIADPRLAGLAIDRAAELAASDLQWPGRGGATAFQLWHNVGKDAGQTEFHIHAHLVPRRAGDGLRLAPWEGDES